ncbi:MAG: DUF5916 domain-containing protein [Vicinamibacterales bacterium]
MTIDNRQWTRWHPTAALVLTLLSPVAGAWAQTPLPATVDASKQAFATRTEPGAVAIDGRLDEDAWATATPIVDFVQGEPVEGAPPTERMEVRFLYDSTALYVGARMYSAPGAVRAPLSRRDDGDQQESIQIELDTFRDRRTAYMFGVTAAGVRLDHFHPTDNRDDEVGTYDPVWRARTAILDDGWTAELWLPFTQLRFNESDERVWGLNVRRYVPGTNEEVYWALVRRVERGWSSRFGELRGITGVAPRGRIEVLPYVVGSINAVGARDPANPFLSALNPRGGAGADVKLGLGSNLTLDATFNPDFAQVEADPAQVNLTAFEVIFPERRPFFLEGNSVLEAGTGNFYYSRRIGARPTGSAPGEYVDYPTAATILGAAKLTGRLSRGLNVGALAAVTDDEFARVSAGDERSRVRVAARSFWGVARAIQEFGRDRSTVGAHLTVVHRALDAADPLAALQARNAVTFGADTRIRLADRTYEANLSIGLTHIDGEAPAIERVQRANSHLFQRPDQPRVRLDPTRHALDGVQIVGGFNKIAGRHWLWGYTQMIESPEFEPSDFGRLNYAGDFMGGPRLTYRETRPGRYLRNYSFALNLSPNSYFDTDLGVRYTLSSNNTFTFLNFWQATLNYSRYFRGQDVQLTRGGPSMGTPTGWSVTSSLRNNTASTLRWSLSGNARGNELGDRSWTTTGFWSWRPSSSLQFSVEPEVWTRMARRRQNGPLNRQYPHVGRWRTSGDLRPALHLRPGRSHHAVDAGAGELHVQAGPDHGRLRRALAASGRYKALGELEPPAPEASASTAKRRAPASPAAPTAATSSPTAPPASSCRTRSSTSAPSAPTSSCAGNGGPAASCMSCGNRIARAARCRANTSAPATSSARGPRPATTSWP